MATLPAPAFSRAAVELKTILFATDFSEASMKAFPYAAALGREFGASVIACHIVVPDALGAAAPPAAPSLYEAERGAAEKELENVLHSPLLQGVTTKSVLASGTLGNCLLDAIRDNSADLVVAGTHGRTGWRRLLLGSAAEEICRISPCPVLTAGPGLPPVPIKFKRILVPTDLSEESMRVLPLVAKLASGYGAAVAVLHILPEETAGNPDTPRLSEPILDRMTSLFEPQLAGLHAEFAIETGDTAEAILRVARDTKADLIAMGIRNAFLPGLRLRTSVAYRVMAACECPVVTWRQLTGD